MKGAVSLMTSVLLSLSSTPKNDIYLCLSGDEESEGEGVKKIVSFLNKEGVRRARVIVGESTSGKLRLGQKAVLGIKILIKGKGTHAAKFSLRENLERNPIQRMIRVIQGLNIFSQRINIVSKNYGGVTFNVGKFLGGTASNTLPSVSEAEVDFRFPPSRKFRDLHALKSSIIREIKKIEPKSQLEIFFEGGFFEISPRTPFVKEIQSLARKLFGKDLEIYFDTPWTEASFYQKSGSVIILGPGKIGQPHTENEYVSLSTLKKVNKIYLSVLRL